MTAATSIKTVRDTIERSLANEPQSVVYVGEGSKLFADFDEYVLTDHLAKDYATVLEPIVIAAKPPGEDTNKVGIWVSGFFGSGKSHFAKIAGHLLADSEVDGTGETARSMFRRLLRQGKPADDTVAELLQQASTYQLDFHLVAFDIQAFHADVANHNVGLTFLRAFYSSLGLSDVVAFAERELELQRAGKYVAFLTLYEEKFGRPWADDRDATMYDLELAACLAELMPERYSSQELAQKSLEISLQDYANLNIDGVVDRLKRWLEQQSTASGRPKRLIFVADEVGAWAGRNLTRIEQVRGFVERLGDEGKGRIWLLVTSQERLSDVVQNAPGQDNSSAQNFIQRLEARFRINVHLESSEVGTVIEERILRKLPTARQELEQLWNRNQGQLSDVAEPPGLELNANYPRPEKERFIRDYPFLPYQIPAAADIFGAMRGVKISSGARSMIKVVFDATRDLAERPLGVVVPWDQIFDSANQDNEFSDESYLGSQGVTYIASADAHVTGTPIQASRVLKCLWLVQRVDRIPRTPSNLARLLVDNLDANILQLEQQVRETLEALAARSYVRRDVTTEQWRYLSQDEVTVEKIVSRLSGEVKQKDLRDEVQRLYDQQMKSMFIGRLTTGKTNTPFNIGVFLNDVPVRNESEPVQLRAVQTDTPAARRARDENSSNPSQPVVYWELPTSGQLEERLRRAMAIERLDTDDEFRRIATDRTKREAENLRMTEASNLRSNAQNDVERAFRSGTVLWSGTDTSFDGSVSESPRSTIETALREKIVEVYHRFSDGDRAFSASNIDKLFTAAPGDRAGLDLDLRLFSSDGQVNSTHPVVEAMSAFLNTSIKTTGQDIVQHFGTEPYGWTSDLLRYAAAAMLVDGRITAVDKSGKRHEDYRQSATRSIFGVQGFRTTRLEIEETTLSVEDIAAARTTLQALGRAPSDGSEIALRDAIGDALSATTRRIRVLDKAKQVQFPLPAAYDGIESMLTDIADAGSRSKIIRAFAAHADAVRDADERLKRLESFDGHAGFEQYSRSQQLLGAALQAGLADDPDRSEYVQNAQDQIGAIKQQRRVLEDWDGQYDHYHSEIRRAFRDTYLPLRTQLSERVGAARQEILAMREFTDLPAGDQSAIRVRYFNEGKPLADVGVPQLQNEQQLLAANQDYSIAHIRALLAALDNEVNAAREAILTRYAVEQERVGEQAMTATWKPSEVFGGKQFTNDAQIEALFNTERDRLIELVRQGKTIQVV